MYQSYYSRWTTLNGLRWSRLIPCGDELSKIGSRGSVNIQHMNEISVSTWARLFGQNGWVDLMVVYTPNGITGRCSVHGSHLISSEARRTICKPSERYKVNNPFSSKRVSLHVRCVGRKNACGKNYYSHSDLLTSSQSLPSFINWMILHKISPTLGR